jgi:hypothetical protein
MKNFKIIDIDPNEIKFIKKNARFMSREEFKALVQNIKRDGQLSSVPFCHKEGEDYVVISGNHRVKASIEAGLTSITIMVGENLTNDEIRAIQLSHNSIVGKDDLTILKELFDEIEEAGLKNYAFIDNSIFDEMQEVSMQIVQPTNEFITIGLMFFDSELSKFEDIIEEIAIAKQGAEVVIPMPKQLYESFTEVVSRIKAEHDIKDYGATLIKMASMASEVLHKEIM